MKIAALAPFLTVCISFLNAGFLPAQTNLSKTVVPPADFHSFNGNYSDMLVYRTLDPVTGTKTSYSTILYEDDPCNFKIGLIGGRTNDVYLIHRVTKNSPAFQVGIVEGDVLIAMDGVPIKTTDDLTKQRDTHHPGDQFTLTILRNNVKQTITAQFKNCTGEAREKTEQIIQQRRSNRQSYEVYMTEVAASLGKRTLQQLSQNKCVPYIGVFTSDETPYVKQGVRVNGVIDKSPAKTAGVLPGDIITGIGTTLVTDHISLWRARDEYQAGEDFTITVLRHNKTLILKTRFKSCETLQQREVETEFLDGYDEDLRVFPNPSNGTINVCFKTEAVPTMLRLFDASGNLTYEKSFNPTSGFYNEILDLTDIKPGSYMLNMVQADHFLSKKIILTPRL